MEQPIRIMIAEDHALFGHGLRRVLTTEPDLVVVAEVKDGAAAVATALELIPDVVLMDVNMPEMNGLMATQIICRTLEGVAVVVLTAYDDEEQLYFALRAGASAYFVKDVSPEELVNAIRVVTSGRYVVGDQIMSRDQVQRWLEVWIEEHPLHYSQDSSSLTPLSQREMEVLQYLVQGASNKVIAANLNISQRTVKNHMTNIMRKLGVSDRTEAAVAALRRGWVPLLDNRTPLPEFDQR
ncbi:MAG: response regulator transcription factor [Caldilineales bacterium]